MPSIMDAIRQIMGQGNYSSQYGRFGGAGQGTQLTQDGTWQSNLHNLFTAGGDYASNQYGSFSRDPLKASQGLTDIMSRDFLNDRAGSSLEQLVQSMFGDEASRLRDTLPGLEQDYYDYATGAKSTGFDATGRMNDFAEAYAAEYAKPGGLLDNMRLSGLSAGIQGGGGPRGGRQERAELNRIGEFNDEFAREIVLQGANLSQIDRGYRSDTMNALGSLLGMNAQRSDSLSENYFTGKMGVENFRIGQGNNLFNMFQGNENINMAREEFKKAHEGGGFLGQLGGILGGVAGSFLGPIGGALGSKLGNKLFGAVGGGGGGGSSFNFNLPQWDYTYKNANIKAPGLLE